MTNEFLDLSKFKKLSYVGGGGFGNVFKVSKEGSDTIYAAKISLTILDQDETNLIINLRREVNILAELSHPSILKFIGYCPHNFEGDPYPVIITEYLTNGSLSSIIEHERKSLSPSGWNDTKKLINIFGISSAMSYLHSHQILHRDLKPDNILEDENFYPKIADFGLSKIYQDNSNTIQSVSGIKGTPVYIPPETWISEEFSMAGDVYAFSMIVYELLTLEKPFFKYNITKIVSNVVNRGERPEISSDVPKPYRELIQRCWDADPEKRPTFDQIVSEIKSNEEFVLDSVDRDEFDRYVEHIKYCGCKFHDHPF